MLKNFLKTGDVVYVRQYISTPSSIDMVEIITIVFDKGGNEDGKEYEIITLEEYEKREQEAMNDGT